MDQQMRIMDAQKNKSTIMRKKARHYWYYCGIYTNVSRKQDTYYLEGKEVLIKFHCFFLGKIVVSRSEQRKSNKLSEKIKIESTLKSIIFKEKNLRVWKFCKNENFVGSN